MQDKKRSSYKNLWIKQRLRDLGMTQSELAAAVGLPQSRINEVIHGKRLIKGPELPRFASALKLPTKDVMNLMSIEAANGFDPAAINSPDSVTIIQDTVEWVGEAGAGIFVSSDYFDHKQMDGVFIGPTKYLGEKIYAATVVGPSMNREVPEGYYALFIDANKNLDSKAPESIDGKCVIVRHHNGVGQFETTIKRARLLSQSPPTYSLVSESYDEKWDGQEVELALNGNEDQAYDIVGIVVGFTKMLF